MCLITAVSAACDPRSGPRGSIRLTALQAE